MTVESTITEHIEFSQDKCEDVALTGIMIHEQHRGAERWFLEEVQWDKSLFTEEENKLLETVAYDSKFFDRFIEQVKEDALNYENF